MLVSADLGRKRAAAMGDPCRMQSFLETCAEHGLSRSTSAPASSLSGFFSIFFSKYARARSTGRSSAVLKFCIILNS